MGNQPSTADYITNFFDGTGAQTTFTLSEVPAKASAILVFVAGVKQASDTYSAVGVSLIFTEAPPTGTNNVEVIHLGIRREIGSVPIDSITSVELDGSDAIAIRAEISVDSSAEVDTKAAALSF